MIRTDGFEVEDAPACLPRTCKKRTGTARRLQAVANSVSERRDHNNFFAKNSKTALTALHRRCILCIAGTPKALEEKKWPQVLGEGLLMAPRKKEVKIGVQVGQGPPPGYKWNVDILDRAFEQAIGFLDEDQYAHMADQVRELAMQGDPTHSETIDVRDIEDFYEIRDKGGVLGKINVRVFFFTHKRKIVVLGAIKKENDGPTPMGDKRTMRRRKRLYLQSNP